MVLQDLQKVREKINDSNHVIITALTFLENMLAVTSCLLDIRLLKYLIEVIN